MRHRTQPSGFTLIELSIVLVIIGLIIGGVLVGRDLIRQAELRSIISDIEKYDAAANTFRTKYNCMPGDCLNATDFWPVETICENPALNLTTPYTPTPHTETCNGNGDGQVGLPPTIAPENSRQHETFRFWQHLANAGLIDGQFNGISGDGNPWFSNGIIGINVPAVRMGGGGISIGNIKDAYMISPGWYYPSSITNVYLIGRQADVLGGGTSFPLLTGAEAFSMDSKIDDGKPAYGNVTSFANDGAHGGSISYFTGVDCAASTTAAVVAETATYVMTDTQPRCSLMLKTRF